MGSFSRCLISSQLSRPRGRVNSIVGASKMLRATYFMVVFLALSWSLSVAAQADNWQRVYSAEEFIVDVKPSTLTYQPGRIVRLQSRTNFSKPEPLDGNSKYKTRLETIEFRADKRYRYYETVLLDATGNTVATYPLSQDWKTFTPGGVTNRLFEFAMSLAPFGYWNVTTYHYADGRPITDSESPEITKFRGTEVMLQFDGAAVGTERCSSPSYESHELADKDFYSRFGISVEPLGVVATQGDAVVLKCESHDWNPAQGLVLPLPTGNSLLLWKGVFLKSKKRRNCNQNHARRTNRWTRGSIACFSRCFIKFTVVAGARPRQLHRYVVWVRSEDK